MQADNNTPLRVVELLEATTGGSGHHLVDVVTRLDKSRFAVSVICSTLRDPAFLTDIETMRKQGIPVTIVPMRRSINPVADLIALLKIIRHLLNLKPDVVHTHSAKAGFLGRLAARMAGIPFVVHTPHVFPFEMHVGRIKKAIYLLLEKSAGHMTDRLVCVSPAEYKVATTCGVIRPDKCVLVENGVEVPDKAVCEQNRVRRRSELGLADDDIVIGSIGRFTQQKGLPFFLAAAQQIAAVEPRARFVLIGSGELRDELKRLSEPLGTRCLIIDAKGNPSYDYPVFDIFVLASLWEGMPYAMLDAMAAGRAIVATRVGGMADAIVDNVHGVLVEPGNVDILASAIVALARLPQKREELGHSARQHVAEQYPVERMIRRLESIYTREPLI